MVTFFESPVGICVRAFVECFERISMQNLNWMKSSYLHEVKKLCFIKKTNNIQQAC